MTSLTVILIQVSTLLGIPQGVLSAICHVESRHKVVALKKNDGGEDSIGACQIKHSTAKWMGFTGTKAELFDPKNNVLYAGKYLRYQLDRYDGDITKAISAYNAGRAAKNKTYVNKVLENMREQKQRKLPDPKTYPKEVYVGTSLYKIVFVPKFKDAGETDSGKHTIKIRAGMSARETYSTFIHEILHAIEFEYGIPISHRSVYRLEIAITNLMLDNFFL